MKNKKGAITQSSMKGLIVGVVLVVVFFGIAVAVLPTGMGSIQELLGHIEGNTTLYGTGPSEIAGVVSDNFGYFVVLGLFGLILAVIGGMFALKKYRR